MTISNIETAQFAKNKLMESIRASKAAYEALEYRKKEEDRPIMKPGPRMMEILRGPGWTEQQSAGSINYVFVLDYGSDEYFSVRLYVHFDRDTWNMWLSCGLPDISERHTVQAGRMMSDLRNAFSWDLFAAMSPEQIAQAPWGW